MPRLPWNALAAGEVTGIKPWGQGINTNPEIVDKKDGVVKMSGYEDGLNVIVGNITEQKHKNVYCEEYARRAIVLFRYFLLKFVFFEFSQIFIISTNPEIVDKKDGVVKMSGYEDGLNVIVGNITEQKHKNVYCEEYALAPLAKVLLDDVLYTSVHIVFSD